MSKSHDKPWKVRERLVAAFHGLVRNPLSGENSGRVGDAYDPMHLVPWVYIEVKLRKSHSVISTLRKHMLQVKKKSGESNPLCILALAENNKKGFWILVHQTQAIRYAILLLEKHGYCVESRSGMAVVPLEDDDDAPHCDA